MVMMLCYNRFYRRYLYLLPISISASSKGIRGNVYSAVAAHLRSMFYNLGWLKQLPSISLAPILLARLSTRWDFRKSFHRGRIAGRRHGRVGRVHPQTSPQFGIFFFKLKVLLLQLLYPFQELLIVFLFNRNVDFLRHIISNCKEIKFYQPND